MKFQKQKFLICFALCGAVCLVLASCGKKISPQEAKQLRLDWNLKTLVDVYQKSGNTDPKWDEPAKNALTEFARSRSNALDPDEDSAQIIRTNCTAAIKAGCDDPLVNYLFIKYAMSQTNSAKGFTDAMCKTADAMQQSSYPPIRKFYASLRALQQVYYTDGTNADRQTTGQLANNLAENLQQIFSDKVTPPEEVYEAGSQGLFELSGGQAAYENCYNQLEPPLFKNWPHKSTSWLLKGEAYIQMGWYARGTGYANTITAEGQKKFDGDLDEAGKSLNEAWKLNPKDERIPLKMLNVELGQGKGRDVMELWFNRAMALDPNDYDICSSKLYYLEPKWYGSTEAMLDFGRECVQSTNWGGRVPIILVDAHIAICNGYTEPQNQTNYWKQPEVWPDIKAAYDRFFELNPKAPIFIKIMLGMPIVEQWDAFIKIAQKVRSEDYNFFGGEYEFDKMVQLAKNHGQPTVAPQQ
jgi:tetratricopeptide (TPR) repeat protein